MNKFIFTCNRCQHHPINTPKEIKIETQLLDPIISEESHNAESFDFTVFYILCCIYLSNPAIFYE